MHTPTTVRDVFVLLSTTLEPPIEVPAVPARYPDAPSASAYMRHGLAALIDAQGDLRVQFQLHCEKAGSSIETAGGVDL